MRRGGEGAGPLRRAGRCARTVARCRVSQGEGRVCVLIVARARWAFLSVRDRAAPTAPRTQLAARVPATSYELPHKIDPASPKARTAVSSSARRGRAQATLRQRCDVTCVYKTREWTRQAPNPEALSPTRTHTHHSPPTAGHVRRDARRQSARVSACPRAQCQKVVTALCTRRARDAPRPPAPAAR